MPPTVEVLQIINGDELSTEGARDLEVALVKFLKNGTCWSLRQIDLSSLFTVTQELTDFAGIRQYGRAQGLDVFTRLDRSVGPRHKTDVPKAMTEHDLQTRSGRR